jgi:hypothetical protein
MPSPALLLDLFDANDERLDEEALVTIRNLVTGRVKQARSVPNRRLKITGLEAGPRGVYRVEADPAGYLAAGTFASLPGDEAEASIWFPVDPRRVKRVLFDAFDELDANARTLLDASHNVMSFAGVHGADLYDRLDDIRKAGFLNIITKCRATVLPVLPEPRSVLGYLQELRELRGDRFFCLVSQELREEVKNAAGGGLFDEVSGSLHHPPPGFEPAGSFKTPDHYGNLQLTFFASSTEWVADIDIDDANGLGHAFQVLRNELTGRPTHPYDIHQILALHQQLHPPYSFEL